MSHPHCLEALADGGASSQSLRSVYAFLQGREMRIKFNGRFSTSRKTPGGAPQGTKCGNFLFAMTADKLGSGEVGDREGDRGQRQEQRLEDTATSSLDLSNYDSTLCFPSNLGPSDGRMKKKSTILDDTAPHPLLSTWPRDRIEDELGLPARWKGGPIKNFVYVDDQTMLETIPRSLAVTAISTAKEQRYIHALGLQGKYQLVDSQSKEIGMQLNLHKTQLLCIGCPLSCDITAYINIDGTVIESTESMKILGYTFGSKPNANLQVDVIRGKAAFKSWSIRHLVKAGVPRPDLVEIYCCFIRSALEYGVSTYGGFLTKQQSDELERLQAKTLRSIFGLRLSYASCLRLAGINSLAKRRELLFAKFAQRVESNPFFRERWLPYAREVPHFLRTQDKYLEVKANCSRLQNAPIFRIRSLLNDLHLKDSNIQEEIERLENDLNE